MNDAKLSMDFAGADPAAVLEGALRAGVLPADPPKTVKVDLKVIQPRDPLSLLATRSQKLEVSWGRQASFERGAQHDRTYVRRSGWDLTPEGMLRLVAAWPFESCLTVAPQSTWWPDYRAVHGWAFFLKGAGHRLVSKRIVDRGPWRLLRDETHDVTLFQFCDIEADADTALEQAKPGHALLAPVWLGGHYASQLWVFRGAARGYQPTFYDAATRTSVVLVQEREVTPKEMGIAAATRVHQIFSEPVEQVAFVYLDEATARRQLPALWLYGLEVRAMTAQGERRIDTEYEPPPLPPPLPWVERLNAR